jgi:hypothetical protein
VSVPLWLSLCLLSCLIGAGLGVWWGKLHPKQAVALLTEADKLAQAAKKV